MSVDFENTEIAFRNRSLNALRRSFWLFRLLSSRTLVKSGSFFVQTALALHLPIEWIIRETVFQQFCGGESIEACSPTIESLGRFHIGTILDFAAEQKNSESDFDATAQEIGRTIELAAKRAHIPFSVFKVTGVARFELLEKVNARATLSEKEEAEWQRARSRVEQLCKKAHEKKVRLLIDAEESWIQDAIDSLTEEMMARFNREEPIVYHTLQMYRADRWEYLQKLFDHGRSNSYQVAVKLVRGAYMEKERARAEELGKSSPILSTKEETDAQFDRTLKFCVENLKGFALCAGTHNENSTRVLMDLMAQHQIPKEDSRIYFAQLLGMSDHLSYNLAANGYNVAKYVPYGPVRSLIPYLFRRAEENTSVAGQTSRELSLITSELRRRKGFPTLHSTSSH